MLARLAAALFVCAHLSACDELAGELSAEPAPYVDPNAFVLGPGFAPDPQVKTGTAGGPVEASQRHTDCRGWIAPAPNHTLVLSAPMPHLRVVVHSSGDPTLVVVRADGSHLCNDDSEGLNSMVEGPFPAGVHQVFVGTYGQGSPAPYSLGVSQGSALQPSHIASSTAPAQPPPPAPPPPPPPAVPPPPPPGAPSGPQPRVMLAPGFAPDPQVQTSWAGGTREASQLDPSCRGYLTPVPQHTLVVRRPLTSLRVMVSAEIDTTLVVRGPDGAVRCNDDSDGLNPAIEGAFAAGPHEIFVGTYGAGQGGAYRLAFTTRADLTAEQLAAMGAPSAVVGAPPPPAYPQHPPPPPPVQPLPPPPVGGPTRVVQGMMPGDMNPQGLTPAQQAAADASGISYHEAREVHRCRGCMLQHDFDHCIYECREPCLDCVSSGVANEQTCGPPCGGRR